MNILKLMFPPRPVNSLVVTPDVLAIKRVVNPCPVCHHAQTSHVNANSTEYPSPNDNPPSCRGLLRLEIYQQNHLLAERRIRETCLCSIDRTSIAKHHDLLHYLENKKKKHFIRVTIE